MWVRINDISNAIFVPWFSLIGGLPSFVQIAVTALPVTVFALLVFRFASSQDGIRAAKDRIKGYLLELWLYKDSPGVLLRAQGQVVVSSLEYLGYSLVPMLIMLVPVGLLVVQLESRFAWRALAPGESAIVTVTGSATTASSGAEPALEVSGGVTTETPALRLPAQRQVLWRVRADEPGRHLMDIGNGSTRIQRSLLSGTRLQPLSPVVYRADDWRVLGYPAEAPLPAGSSLSSIEIGYQRDRAEFLGLSSASWLLLGMTLLLGFALRGVFGVTF